MRRVWTEEMLQELRDRYPDTDSDDLARRFGVTRQALATQAYKLGVKKSAAGLKVANDASWRNGGHRGAFKKGNKPAHKWNKGVHLSPATEFAAGHIPHNTLHDGAITVRRDSKGRPYQWIRIRMAKWVMLHRHVWETANGPIPKGYVVRFVDGDTMNCKLDNLEMVSMTMNALLNSKHGYTREMAEAAEQLAFLKHTIRSEHEKLNA